LSELWQWAFLSRVGQALRDKAPPERASWSLRRAGGTAGNMVFMLAFGTLACPLIWFLLPFFSLRLLSRTHSSILLHITPAGERLASSEH
jgi:hypothetical protein